MTVQLFFVAAQTTEKAAHETAGAAVAPPAPA